MTVTTVTTSDWIHRKIAEELGIREHQVRAAVGLLDDGSTVPFIARYRKEATDALDDAQLRALDERLRYLRELDERRQTVLDTIREQGKLTEELEAQIMAAETKARLEDIYLPYKPRRRTKAQIAREAGLEPLADALLGDPALDPAETAAGFVTENVPDTAAALDGARSILAERFAEDADLIGELRERLWSQGRLVSAVSEGIDPAAPDAAKYADYFDFAEALSSARSHRVLALFRGEKEGVLDVTVDPFPAGHDPADPAAGPSTYEAAIAARSGIQNRGRPADSWLADAVRWAWRTRILAALSLDVRMRAREAAEEEAIRVFAGNLRDLLHAAPAGSRPTMGLDPAYRTGVKVAVVDGTGKVVATAAVYPHKPQGRWSEALDTLETLVRQHGVELIAIGNGTASRETDRLAAELVKRFTDRTVTKVVVSEAGASVYSASSFASRELPDLDVSLRGAVSIARRLQDPLAELVKIDPKSIGVGQYQHDLSETALSRSLDAVVEDCVNAVGVDLNTASTPLLNRVSGISAGLAANIVAHRERQGPFRSRAALQEVPRLGPKAFEQCAGFLRIRGGDEPLDASSVHPESYPLARKIAQAAGGDVATVLGNERALRGLKPADFADGTYGLPTVGDVLAELQKPGRDPRPSFTTAAFTDGVETVADVKPGMRLEGVVTNVAAFGAFVDVGVHQDGLVHISAMSHTFVENPRDVVKPGDVVTVKVLDVDMERNRISLTLRLDDEVPAGKASPARGSGGPGDPGGKGGKDGKGSPGGKRRGQPSRSSRGSGNARSKSEPGGAIADALRRAGYRPPPG